MSGSTLREPEAEPTPIPDAPPAAAHRAPVVVPKARLRTLLSVPLASLIALGVHFLLSKQRPSPETRSYSLFLGIVLVLALVAAAVQPFWPQLRRWMIRMCPIFAAAALLLCV